MKDEITEPGAAADHSSASSSSILHPSHFKSASAPWVLALALMAALVVLLPALAGRSVVDFPWVADLGYQWAPFSDFVRNCYRAGVFPLWDPYDMCGMPFLAFAHTGSLYLPAVAAQAIAGAFQPGASLDILFHLALAAVAAFALFRAAQRSRTASFCAAAAFAFSGYYFNNLSFLPSLHTGAWLVLWYAGAFMLLKRPRFKWFALSSVAFAAMLLAGDLELCVFAVLGMGFELWLRLRERSLTARAALALVCSVLAGAMLSAPLLLPAAELQHMSLRAGASISPGLGGPGALAPLALALFQVPVPAALLSANHGLDPWYLGAFPLLLAAYGLKHHAYARRRLLCFPAAAAYMVLMYEPHLRPLSSQVPILGGMQVPFRVWPVLEIFFLLAASFALDEWMAREPAAAPGHGAADDQPVPLGRGGAAFLIVFAALTALSLLKIHHGLAARAVFCVVLAAAGLAAWLRLPLLSRPRARPFLAVVLVLIDLYLLALVWLPMSPKNDFRVDPRLAPVLTGTAARERYAIISITGILDPALPYHLGLRLDAATIDSFSRVPPRQSADRLAELYPSLYRYRDARLVHYDQMGVRDPKNLDPARLGLFNDMNVGWIVSRFPWKPPGPGLELTAVLSDPDLYIYRNAAALPRAREESGGRTVARAVSYPAPDVAIVEGGTEVTLSDSWYPGWRAFAGGREIKIGETGPGFREFSSPDSAPVVMRYMPASFRAGLFTGLATAAGLLLMVLLVLLPARASRRPPCS